MNEDGATPTSDALNEVIEVSGRPVSGLNDEIFRLGERMIAAFGWILRSTESVAG